MRRMLIASLFLPTAIVFAGEPATLPSLIMPAKTPASPEQQEIASLRAEIAALRRRVGDLEKKIASSEQPSQSTPRSGRQAVAAPANEAKPAGGVPIQIGMTMTEVTKAFGSGYYVVESASGSETTYRYTVPGIYQGGQKVSSDVIFSIVTVDGKVTSYSRWNR